MEILAISRFCTFNQRHDQTKHTTCCSRLLSIFIKSAKAAQLAANSRLTSVAASTQPRQGPQDPVRQDADKVLAQRPDSDAVTHPLKGGVAADALLLGRDGVDQSVVAEPQRLLLIGEVGEGAARLLARSQLVQFGQHAQGALPLHTDTAAVGLFIRLNNLTLLYLYLCLPYFIFCNTLPVRYGCLSAFQAVYLPDRVSACLPVYLFACLLICLPRYSRSACLPARQSVFMPASLSKFFVFLYC
jgi:hypothetical protein